MGFWIAVILIVAVVTVPLISALRGARGQVVSGAASDLQIYRDQLIEVDRDLARGVLSDAEAEAVRIEVSRRLLEADRRMANESTRDAGQHLPGAILVVGVLAVGGAWLYTLQGAPGYPDLPMGQRLAEIDTAATNRMRQEEAEAEALATLPPAPEADTRFLDLMSKLRAAIAERPDDVVGLALLAENEARLGNYTEAHQAQTRLIELKGDRATEADYVMAIDIMVFSTGGYVSPEAETLIRELLNADPSSGSGRYYAGLVLAQNGRPDQAFPIWRRLLESSPPDAPWVPVIMADIEGIAAAAGVDYRPPALPGPDAGDIAAAGDMSDTDRQAMIRGMVEGLAERLATDGGAPEEWARLISALGVLGEVDRAGAITAEARTAFADSEAALRIIEAAAKRAGLSE